MVTLLNKNAALSFDKSKGGDFIYTLKKVARMVRDSMHESYEKN